MIRLRVLAFSFVLGLLTAGIEPVSADVNAGLSLTPGIYEVRSVFRDDLTNASLEIQGSAYVLNVPESQTVFLISAAHVMAGKNPRIYANGKIIPLNGKTIVDSESDIYFTQLDPTLQVVPAGTWNSQLQIADVNPELIQAWQSRPTHFLPVQSKPRSAFVPKGSWIPHSSVVQGTSTRDERLKINLLTSEISAPLSIVRGMSGAPLVDWYLNEKNKPVIRGVAVQFDRHFGGSYFASELKLAETLKKIRSGDSGEISTAQWYYRNGFSYRKQRSISGEELGETAFFAGRTESGRGARSDGGSGLPAQSIDRAVVSEARSEGLKIYGATENGSPILGWRTLNYFVFADYAGVQLRSRVDGQMTAIPVSASFIPILLQRFFPLGFDQNGKVWGEWILRDVVNRQNSFQGILRAANVNAQNLHAQPNNGAISSALTTHGPHGIQIQIRGLEDDDQLDLDLNPYGSDMRSLSQIYEPIVTTTSKKRKYTYIIDTRSLFFADTDKLSITMNENENYRTIFQFEQTRLKRLTELWQEAISPRPSLRIKCLETNSEFHLEFRP